MKINVYFGKEGSINCLYLDKQSPLNQVKDIKELVEKEDDFNIYSYSPYIIEAVDIYGKKVNAEIKYFNKNVETNIISILDNISEAFYILQESNN